MPAAHEALIDGVRITYRSSATARCCSRLDLAPSDPAAARALLARVAEAVGRRVRTLLADAPDAPWILEDSEVWGSSGGALRRLGLHLPEPPVPTDPAMVPALLYKGGKSVQDGFAAEGWRLDPSAVTADGWSYASSRRCCARGRRT